MARTCERCGVALIEARDSAGKPVMVEREPNGGNHILLGRGPSKPPLVVSRGQLSYIGPNREICYSVHTIPCRLRPS